MKKVVKILFIFYFFLSCQKEDVKKEVFCNPTFFELQKEICFNDYKNKRKIPYFTLHCNFFYSGFCGYLYTLKPWTGLIQPIGSEGVLGDFNSSSGFLFENNNSIFIAPYDFNNYYSFYPIKLLDFNLRLNNSYSFNGVQLKKDYDIIPFWQKYSFKLESINDFEEDKIYKFRYFGIYRWSDNKSLVIYAGKKKGIIGMYISYYSNNSKNELLEMSLGVILDSLPKYISSYGQKL